MRTIIYALVFAWLSAASLPAAGESLAKYPPAYSNLLRDAMRSFSERDFPTSLALVDRADSLHAPTPTSLNIRGAIAIEERRFEEGRKLCLDALRQDPHFFPARFNLAEIPFVQGKYAEARNIFEKLQEEHPKDELLQFRIYLTYLLEKNESAAKNALDQVPFLSNTPIYYYSHAAWEFAHGNMKMGKDWIDRGNWVFPPARTRNYADVFYDLGWLTRPGTAASAQSAAATAAGAPTAPEQPAKPPEKSETAATPPDS